MKKNNSSLIVGVFTASVFAATPAAPATAAADVKPAVAKTDVSEKKEKAHKALKKHKSKRKDAATDLGISERTLYRKLKEYDIND